MLQLQWIRRVFPTSVEAVNPPIGWLEFELSHLVRYSSGTPMVRLYYSPCIAQHFHVLTLVEIYRAFVSVYISFQPTIEMLLTLENLGIAAGCGTVVFLLFSVFGLVFSPLSQVPGPFWARLTNWWYFQRVAKGHFEHDNLNLHRKYGALAISTFLGPLTHT